MVLVNDPGSEAAVFLHDIGVVGGGYQEHFLNLFGHQSSWYSENRVSTSLCEALAMAASRVSGMSPPEAFNY